MKGKSPRTSHRNNLLQRKALALAIGGSIALTFGSGAFAQAVNGTIRGTVPVAANESIQITGGAGYNRTITVGPSGQYSVTLPVVTTTNQVTTITAKQLQQLPLARTAEDIALLAPGVGLGNPELVGGPLGTPANVFGGASTAENAYYVDGMNTTEALNSQGGITLPYGAIQQQQTFISGYGARYGRSIGGVINQIGKSGSNEWHFGARAQWQPAKLRSDPINYYFNNPLSTDPGSRPGDIAVYRKDNNSSE